MVDLTSTHGTFVNKVLVPKGGEAGVRVGDILKFGESSRLYLLEGPAEEMPEEYDSENLRKLRKKLASAGVVLGGDKPGGGGNVTDTDGNKRGGDDIYSEKGTETPSTVSWGFGEDAEDEEQEEGGGRDGDDDAGTTKFSSSKMLGDLPEYLLKANSKDKERQAISISKDDVHKKDVKVYEKMQKKQEKIDNMYLEIDRIRSKESKSGGLTEGQEAQISKNEQAILKLTDEIATLEKSLQEKNDVRRGSSEAGTGPLKGVEDVLIDSDDDDYYDRTNAAAEKRKAKEKGKWSFKAASSTKRQMGEIETAESLGSKLEVLRGKKTKAMEDMASAEADIAKGMITFQHMHVCVYRFWDVKVVGN